MILFYIIFSALFVAFIAFLSRAFFELWKIKVFNDQQMRQQREIQRRLFAESDRLNELEKK